MIRSLFFHNGKTETNLRPEDWARALRTPKGLLWVDFEATPRDEDQRMLTESFRFHPLAIDDALEERHVPKVDDWGDYLYIVLHEVELVQRAEEDQSLHFQSGEICTHELDVFLGKNYMVTHHDEPLVAVNRVWNSIDRDVRHLYNGPDHLLYRLVDEVVAGYMPVVETLDDLIDEAEDEIFGRPTPHTLQKIFTLKRSALHLRRIVGPQREVLNKLARDDYPVIDARDRVYFRDVYDHLVRLHDITESLRDLVSGALDSYLSVVNNRMNEVMKTLTIITTLFMPISFVSGFFGMNFFQPVSEPLFRWTSMPVFILTMLIMILTPIGMMLWMARRGWMVRDHPEAPISPQDVNERKR